MVAMVAEPAWLGSVSICKGSRERPCLVYVGRQPSALVVFFVVVLVLCVMQCLCSFLVFRGCCGSKKTKSVSRGAVTSLQTCTDILHLVFRHMLFLPPHTSRESFNVDRSCPHPSLEGRGE